MNHLSAQQRSALRAALLARSEELTQRLAEHHGGLSRVEHASELLEQDGRDAPQREAERERDLAQSDRDTLELSATDRALARFDDGSYGRCADCDDDIPAARLEAEPWALRCIDCETAREEAARRHA